jgi:hypothetical protein
LKKLLLSPIKFVSFKVLKLEKSISGLFTQ